MVPSLRVGRLLVHLTNALRWEGRVVQQSGSWGEGESAASFAPSLTGMPAAKWEGARSGWQTAKGAALLGNPDPTVG